VSLRARLITYFAVVHVLAAAVAVLWLRRAPYWLLPVEALFVLSLATGVWLLRRVFQGITLAAGAARLLDAGELTARFLPVGDPDVDELIALYNTMVDSLRHERVRVEEQQQFFDRVLQVSPSGLIVLDLSGRVASLNPAAAQLLGVTERSLTGQPLTAIAGPLADRLATMAAGATDVWTLPGPRRVRGHHGTFMDRGFRRDFYLIDELTDELRRAERAAYEQLIRVMSHEINNTVTATNSLLHASLTSARQLQPPARGAFERAVGTVIDRTEQLRLFTSRFADVFRLPVPAREICDLRAVLEPLVSLMQAQPANRGIEWRWEVRDSVSVLADRAQLEQASLNVLKNAAEAAGPDGVVLIRISREQGRPTLVIEDSGPGPAGDAVARLFTPFFTTKPQGHGIGLTLVQEILSAHGATFSLDRAPGTPTRFRIQF
jgi:nitrogen fixation/metabolism regulation signal transduction histidine kinase